MTRKEVILYTLKISLYVIFTYTHKYIHICKKKLDIILSDIKVFRKPLMLRNAESSWQCFALVINSNVTSELYHINQPPIYNYLAAGSLKLRRDTFQQH